MRAFFIVLNCDSVLWETKVLPIYAGGLLLKKIKRETQRSKRPQSPEKIWQSKTLLASIVDSSEDAIIGKTLEGIITSWNRGAQRIYGYSGEEVMGKSISILAPPDRPDEIPEILKKI